MYYPHWERLLYGKDLPAHLPTIPFGNRIRATYAYSKAWRLYRRDGFASIMKYLAELQEQYNPLCDNPNTQVILARRLIATFSWVSRLHRQDGLCLPVSVSLTAGLIACGFKAEVILGKPRLYLVHEHKFHAWTEIAGVPVNGNAITQRTYIKLAAFPTWLETRQEQH